jgi:hypothetical protein
MWPEWMVTHILLVLADMVIGLGNGCVGKGFWHCMEYNSLIYSSNYRLVECHARPVEAKLIFIRKHTICVGYRGTSVLTGHWIVPSADKQSNENDLEKKNLYTPAYYLVSVPELRFSRI